MAFRGELGKRKCEGIEGDGAEMCFLVRTSMRGTRSSKRNGSVWFLSGLAGDSAAIAIPSF